MTEPDTEGRAVPPYDGRRETADIDGADEAVKDGAYTGGATGLVEDDRMKAPDPAETEGGATTTPADEHPASQMSQTEDSDDGVGPAHEPGTSRAEDLS